jgi:hypothetical protein
LRTGTTLSLLAAVLAFTAWRAAAVSQAAGYGTTGLNMTLLHKNALWLFQDALQWNTSWIITAGLVASLIPAVTPLCRALRWGVWFRRDQCHLFVLGVLAANILSCLTSWRPVLRYWYPVLFALSFLAALGHTRIRDFLISRSPAVRAAALAVASAWLLYFAAANYANYIWQFASLHHSGHTDRVLLNGIDSLLQQGQSIAIGYRKRDPEPEMVPHARSYFMEFLPYFHGRKRVKFIEFEPPARSDSPHLVSPRSREQGMRRMATFEFPAQYPLFETACRISSFAQGRPFPYLNGDAGVHDFDYAWHLWAPEDARDDTSHQKPRE